jgi:hypothetical protein
VPPLSSAIRVVSSTESRRRLAELQVTACGGDLADERGHEDLLPERAVRNASCEVDVTTEDVA